MNFPELRSPVKDKTKLIVPPISKPIFRSAFFLFMILYLRVSLISSNYVFLFTARERAEIFFERSYIPFLLESDLYGKIKTEGLDDETGRDLLRRRRRGRNSQAEGPVSDRLWRA